jgi:hypothetical protein
MPRFRVTASIRSTNKPAKTTGVWVSASNKKEAERAAKTKIAKDNPSGIVRVTGSEQRESKGPIFP